MDIFVNDYLYRDEKREAEREKLFEIAYSLARMAQGRIKDKHTFNASVERLSAVSGYRIKKTKNMALRG